MVVNASPMGPKPEKRRKRSFVPPGLGIPIDPKIAPKTAKCAKSEEKRRPEERLGRAMEKISKNGLSLQEHTCVSTTPVQSKHSFQDYKRGDPNHQK